jgi:DNA-binding beta-propeller fold protein YncE
VQGIRAAQGRAIIVVAALALLVPAAADAKRNVYVTHFNSSNVSAFDISSTGALTPVPGSPFASGGTTDLGVAASLDGKHLFVANANSGNISVFSVATDGSLTPIAGSPFASPGGPTGVAVSPDGKRLYVTGQLTANVRAFDIAANGALTPVAGSPFAAGARAYGVSVTPDGKHVYVANRDAGTVSGYDVAPDGSLTPVPGSPVGAGTGSHSIVPSLDGKHIYVANLTSSNISAYDVAANGSLTPVTGSPFPGGAGSVGLAAAPDGKHLYVSNVGGSVSSFSMAADGSLSNVAGSPFANTGNAVAVAVSPDGKHLYVSNQNNTVSAYDVAADETLSAVAGSPFATGGATPDFQSVTVSPDQPPVASFAATGLTTGGPTAFDATASTDSDGTIVRYDWDFGDGTTLADGGPSPSHTYAAPGTYQARVTETDNEGCSTALVYFGQSAYCNGSAVATQSKAVQITDGIAPQVTITTPSEGATYERRQVVPADYACADEGGGSGLKSCAGDVPNGQPIDTSTAGSHTFTVVGTDNAGNAVQKKVGYQVVDSPPVIEHLAVTPHSFASDQASTPLSKGGAQIKVTLSEDAKVRFRVRHDPARSNSGAYPSPHVFKRQLAEGKNSVSFTATLGKRTFAPGRYVLIARARDDAGQPSERATAKFEITG